MTKASYYDCLIKPVFTEKASKLLEKNQYVFKVATNTTKIFFKTAVEAVFSVKVKKVNSMNIQGKVKRFKGRIGKRSDYKKMIVTLMPGNTIDLEENI